MVQHVTQSRQEQTKKRSEKRKLRLFPCANFVSGGGKKTQNLQMSTPTIGMLLISLAMVNVAPFPSL